MSLIYASFFNIASVQAIILRLGVIRDTWFNDIETKQDVEGNEGAKENEAQHDVTVEVAKLSSKSLVTIDHSLSSKYCFLAILVPAVPTDSLRLTDQIRVELTSHAHT